ncbi:Aste57867_10930 [Aphanomyces stellatus]|uniref:Aste57867_10930 protein n=1 Tax=Aphanomyces stellatus TaxID=120398 RepID=A0A485KS59_9STRA|nr:hypothetical protein As57867_010890 [Aphanomyces stellatus]VFT87798.1 Aste57867_10930 [Aphanomyces stellatus]
MGNRGSRRSSDGATKKYDPSVAYHETICEDPIPTSTHSSRLLQVTLIFFAVLLSLSVAGLSVGGSPPSVPNGESCAMFPATPSHTFELQPHTGLSWHWTFTSTTDPTSYLSLACPAATRRTELYVGGVFAGQYDSDSDDVATLSDCHRTPRFAWINGSFLADARNHSRRIATLQTSQGSVRILDAFSESVVAILGQSSTSSSWTITVATWTHEAGDPNTLALIATALSFEARGVGRLVAMESPTMLDLRVEEASEVVFGSPQPPSQIRSPGALGRATSHRNSGSAKMSPMPTRRSSTFRGPSPSSSPPKTPAHNVLDEKSLKMREVLQDYGPYTPRKEYSCRSLPVPRDQDFVLRHNAQNIHDFKKEYSKRYGTLNRRPPKFLDGYPTSGRLSPTATREPLWEETSDKVWMLSDHGHETLVMNNLSPMPRATITLPALPHNHQSSTSPFHEKAAVGRRVDLSKDTSFASLVRQELYSPRPAPAHSTAKARNPKYALEELKLQLTRRPSTSDGLTLSQSKASFSAPQSTRPFSSDDRDGACRWPLQSPSPPTSSSIKSPSHRQHPPDTTHVTSHALMEIEPSIVNFHVVHVHHTYHFPVKVHNFGTKTERFRVRNLTIKSGGDDCHKAEAHYDKEKAKLAPGLVATVTLVVTFASAGTIQGVLEIETPSGKGGVAIIGAVEHPILH